MASREPAILQAPATGRGQARLVEVGRPRREPSRIVATTQHAVELVDGHSRVDDQVDSREPSSYASGFLDPALPAQVATALARTVVHVTVVLVQVAGRLDHEVGARH